MIDYEKILDEAHAAAAGAVEVASQKYPEQIGACGFAWATIPGNEALARHCRAQIAKLNKQHGGNPPRSLTLKYGSKGYPSGWQFWNPGGYMGQRIEVKEFGAAAFRDELAAAGIRADTGSRLD